MPDVSAPVRVYSNMTPATLNNGNNIIIAAPSSDRYNIIESLGIQNGGSVARTVTLYDGATAFRSWILDPGDAVEVNLEAGKEWVLSGAFVINASAGSDVNFGGGRYRVAAQ